MTQPVITYQHLLQAVALAARAHHGQMRKDEETPYMSHPFRAYRERGAKGRQIGKLFIRTSLLTDCH